VFVDLGASPLANRYLEPADLAGMEPTYPLRVNVCTRCWLVQLPALVAPEEIFSDYAYFSSYSDSWLAHCEKYAADVAARFGLGASSKVVEIASNDGYLLQYFAARGIPVMGVEPARNVAMAAEKRGIPTTSVFFGAASAEQLAGQGQADLLVANNVLAHVPDLNDFIRGLQRLLKPGGVITVEFPHLLRLMEFNQFDTIYHEHFSYFSLCAVEAAFERHDLVLFDVEELPAHGGSLRIYATHRAGEASKQSGSRLEDVRRAEIAAGLNRIDGYERFARQVEDTKRGLLSFLIEAKRKGSRIAGYGAPAKGNTLLNYCGIRTDFLDYTVDRSEHKQGRFLPGSRIPIFAPAKIAETKPDYVLILPWNLRDEIADQMRHIRTWGGRFVVPIPRVEILE
jgi:SAM-dependent methyltransferase